MSFERFSTSDVYIFEHVGGFIECCGCLLSKDTDDSWFIQLKTPREAISHLDKHILAGHDIGHALESIMAAYPDLDVEIEPYVRTPEEEARIKEFFRTVSMRNHPPKRFRDTSNGE
jgi:hypothetical protein